MFFNNHDQLEANVSYKAEKFQREAESSRSRLRRKSKENPPVQREQFLREILSRVKYGEITVEEGLQRLRQV
jgi:hypothetical protein